MANGFLYALFNCIVECFNSLNLVELFKMFSKKLTKDNSNVVSNCNIAIDIFMVCKWGIVGIFWYNDINNLWSILITTYLILTNVHTYFYYHAWEVRALADTAQSVDWSRRRLLSLLLALSYLIFCYSYLYAIVFNADYKWPSEVSNIQALHFSLTNALTGSGLLMPISNKGVFVMGTQFALTFIFVAVLLSRVPKVKDQVGEQKKDKVDCIP